MAKPGIVVDIPGFGMREIRFIVSDYTGTHSCAGKMTDDVKGALRKLADLVDIHVLTSDTFGTVRKELEGIPVHIQILTGQGHDQQKAEYVRKIGASFTAAFGNGNNDRMLLKTVKDAGGLAVAVDNGEGCALDAILASNLFIVGSLNALTLLLDTNRVKATLRF